MARTIDIHVTYLQGTMVVHSDVVSRNTIHAGFRCSHAAIRADHLDTDEKGLPIEPCGWCLSQGMDGTYLAIDVVECEVCNDVFDIADFINHHKEGDCL
jgi:hypothetical protein